MQCSTPPCQHHGNVATSGGVEGGITVVEVVRATPAHARTGLHVTTAAFVHSVFGFYSCAKASAVPAKYNNRIVCMHAAIFYYRMFSSNGSPKRTRSPIRAPSTRRRELTRRKGFILSETLVVAGFGFQLFRVSAGGAILYQGFC